MSTIAFTSVDSVSSVIDTLDAIFPHTKIENLCDSTGKELPIRGVFFASDEDAKKFGADSRLVVLHSKGEGYYFQSREDAIDQAITAFKAVRSMGGDDIEMRANFHKGYYVSFAQKIEHRNRRFMFENDVLIPSYNFRFSYDSTSNGDGGAKRIVCSNLITTRKIAGFHFSVRHTKNMGEKMIAIENGIAKIAQNWEAFMEYCEAMAKTSFDLVKFYAEIYGDKPDSKRGVTVWQNRLEAIEKRLRGESSKLGISPTNGWLIFNAIQGYLSHDATRKEGEFLVRSDLANSSPELAKAESLILGA